MHHQTPFFSASTQQKGRPRKRKPLPQHGQTDDNIIITTPGSHDHLSHEGALRLGENLVFRETTLEHAFDYFERGFTEVLFYNELIL